MTTVAVEPADWLWRAATWRNAGIALAVTAAIFAGFWLWSTRMPPVPRIGAPGRQTAAEIAAKLRCLGDDGKRYYLASTLTLDLLFPIAYSLLFSLAIGAALHALHRPSLQLLRFVPFAAAAADYAENTFIVRYCAGWASADEAAKALAVLTPAKWWLIAASTGIALVLGLWALVHRLRS